VLLTHCLLLAQGCQPNCYATAKDYFCQLAEQLIENTFETRALRKRADRASFNAADTIGAAKKAPAIVLHASNKLVFPTPTKQFRKGHPTHAAQGRCMVCKSALSTYVCRECQQHQPNPAKEQY
jgi:hypothetical protein